jgi:hypothetical protein
LVLKEDDGKTVPERNLHPFTEKPFEHDYALGRRSLDSGQEPVMNVRCLSLILLLLLCAVPLASAGGMAKVYLSPAEANWKTGQTVQVKVMYDNNLNPVARDISLYLDWNYEMLKYEGCDFKVGRSTVAGLISSHELNLMLGEFTTGYKNGDYPLAVLTFKVIGPGETPIMLRVGRLNDMNGKPVKFVVGKGMYTISGDAVANPGTVAVPRPTTLPAAGQPSVIVVTPGSTYTLIPTLPQATVLQPVAVATPLPPVQPVQPIQPVQTALVGGAPAWPVLTPGATVPTPVPTTIEVTVPTPEPTPEVVTTVPTTLPTPVPTTAVPTTWPTAVPTTEEATPAPTATTVSPIAFQTGNNIGVSAGIPIYDTPEPNETPTTLRTLPQPIPHDVNLTEEPTEVWPLDDETPTETPTFLVIRGTPVTTSPINNTSAALAAPEGSAFGDAWLFVLAGAAGVALVALGVVFVRRKRDDGWL